MGLATRVGEEKRFNHCVSCIARRATGEAHRNHKERVEPLRARARRKEPLHPRTTQIRGMNRVGEWQATVTALDHRFVWFAYFMVPFRPCWPSESRIPAVLCRERTVCRQPGRESRQWCPLGNSCAEMLPTVGAFSGLLQVSLRTAQEIRVERFFVSQK